MTNGLEFLAPSPIGVFDSGVGGLSVLRALRERLPGVSTVYVGDVAYAPYGERSRAEVIDRSETVVAWLVELGARLIVVACNTATVLAIESLRARWPGVTFVGVEPGVKPAAARSRSGRIAVMATAATARSERLRHLIARHAEGKHVHVQACAGLASAIEDGVLEGPALREVLQPHCDAILAASVDTVVLGCTHYPFIEEAIRKALGDGISLVGTATAIAERAAAMWERGEPFFEEAPQTRVFSTASTDTMGRLVESASALRGSAIATLRL